LYFGRLRSAVSEIFNCCFARMEERKWKARSCVWQNQGKSNL